MEIIGTLPKQVGLGISKRTGFLEFGGVACGGVLGGALFPRQADEIRNGLERCLRERPLSRVV